MNPVLSQILVMTVACGCCGSLAAVAVRFINWSKEGPRIDQVAGVGFLIGAAFGAFFGIFESLMNRT